MLPLEHLHLKHVLQTVCSLEAVILRSFGPEGGQVLFTRDTGQAMLSRSGTRILTALNLEHPLARMVVECVWKHSTVTGDGSKTFILLLASLLRMINLTASKEPNVSQSYDTKEAAKAATARHLADKLLAFALTELDDLIAEYVAPYGFCVSLEEFTPKTQSPHCTNCHFLHTFLSSFFHTRLSHVHCDFISDLTCELLSHWKLKNDPTYVSLQFLDDSFPALHTPVAGFPVNCSCLIEGQVIHRDFVTPCKSSKQPVKAVVFTEYLQPKLLSQGDVLELCCTDEVMEEKSIVHFSSWTERSLECIIAKLQSFGVSVLLSSVKQSAAVLALATQAEMCLVECVSEEELSLFGKLSGTAPVLESWKIQPEHVATLSFCQPILLGAHRYVHVAFCDSEEKPVAKPCSLVICAPVEGQTDQYARAFQDAIRMLLTTWEPMPMPENAASKRPLQSHNSTSLHGDNLTNSTSCGSSSMLPLQKHVVEPGCVIPAGGTFEFLLHHALFQYAHRCLASDDTKKDIHVSQLLANALLSVPRQIYSHSSKLFLQTQTRVMTFISNHSLPFNLVLKQANNTGPIQTECHVEDCKLSSNCFRKDVMPSNFFLLDLGLESVSCKYKLLLSVLQCVTSLLRVDAVLHIHNTQSHRLTNSSWEGTEDEAEG
ncbi:Bardet-Biedl syndrome 10 protein [Melanotaenia boesemani]|uniref:Bardet-Biedl syndrome 10 protein n=1 Tax=Melanotaenia boesemani TaxID=1250792 RepID=UPI001C05C672|nr:Bardet-Biedl syndrome 10 protein [Melanotaenia boesemani]